MKDISTTIIWSCLKFKGIITAKNIANQKEPRDSFYVYATL